MASDTAKLKGWEFPLAAVLAWLVPGAGHFYLGLRKRALLLFIAIELTFFIGLYIGTLRIVDPAQSMFWFVAQVLAGLNTIVAHLWSTSLPGPYAEAITPLVRDWSYHMAVLYTGIAGLLNLLAVFDTVIRAGRANVGQAPLPAD
jgi:hypothetical protein